MTNIIEKSTAPISVTNLTISYDREIVLEKISFAVAPGRVTYVLGGNGAGKTTLIRTILGLHEQYRGRIELFGRKADRSTVADNIGYVPQHASIDRNFPISVEEMIGLECTSRHSCPISVADHLQVFNAGHLLHRKISDLSGGELQKVLIVRALVIDPGILIMDEPFNNLDHTTEIDLIQLIQKIIQNKEKTVLIVTHDYNIINPKHSDCLLLSHKGAQYGPAVEVLKAHFLKAI